MSKAPTTWLRRAVARDAYWLAPLLIAAFALTVFLLFQGERGAAAADVLALFVGIVGVVLTLIAVRRQHAQPQLIDEPTGTRLRVLAGLITATLGILAALSIWLWNTRYSDLQVRFDGARQVAEGESWLVQATVDQLPWRGTLTLTPRLSPATGLGNCILPATVHVTPIIDGQPFDRVSGRHDAELSVPVPEGSQQVQLRVELFIPGDQGCVVKATFVNGVLHR